MFSWLKNKTFEGLRSWFSEKRARAYQTIHTFGMKEIIKQLPQELQGVNKALGVLNNNSWAIHHLLKRALWKKQYANAFLYYFYSFELTLKHLIISEMHLRNAQTILTMPQPVTNFFPIYSEKEMVDILDLGPTGEVIKKFLSLFQRSTIRDDLWTINRERNNIIHDLPKKEMSEIDITQSFQGFFLKTFSENQRVLKEFDHIMAQRPQGVLQKLTRLQPNTPQTEMGQPSP